MCMYVTYALVIDNHKLTSSGELAIPPRARYLKLWSNSLHKSKSTQWFSLSGRALKGHLSLPGSPEDREPNSLLVMSLLEKCVLS